MNLLIDPLFPMVDASGERTLQPLSAVADPRFYAFRTGRADTDLALTQVVIAVLQTIFAAPDMKTWAQQLRTPPTPQELQRRFDLHQAAFQFDGDGHRFMQDGGLRNAAIAPTAIGSLFVDAPGVNTLAQNKDFFVKRGRITGLCESCACIALATLQINGPAGGAGYRTGVRGGGPLTTLLVADDAPGKRRPIWAGLWLNTLTEPNFHAIGGDPSLTDPQRTYPWMGASTRLQPEGSVVAPSECHPAMVQWGTPRRIWIDFQRTEAGACGLCGVAHGALLTQYKETNYGLNFKGAWRHPLSPYYSKDGEWLPVHPNPGGLGWRHWAGFVLGTGSAQGDGEGIDPARVISQLSHSRHQWPTWSDARPGDEADKVRVRLEIGGYDMDSAKARCWYATTMPLHHLDEWTEEERELLRGEIEQWVKATYLAAAATRSAVNAAWFGHGSRGNIDFIVESMWARTETDFHELLERRTRDFSEEGDGRRTADAARTNWLDRLQRAAKIVFDEHAASGAIEATNPAQIKRAHDLLLGQLRGRPIRTALGLPEPA